MSKLTLTYQDTIANHEQSGFVMPDAGGVYQLAVLQGQAPLKLKLMRVNALKGEDDFLPFPSASAGAQPLHIPADWKGCHLTVALYATKSMPKYLVFLVATENKVTTSQASKLVNAQDGKTPILVLQVLTDHPALPIQAEAKVMEPA